jgi:hypothetical protein
MISHNLKKVTLPQPNTLIKNGIADFNTGFRFDSDGCCCYDIAIQMA